MKIWMKAVGRLSHSLPLIAPVLITQEVLLNLAGRRARQSFDELNSTRALEVSEVRAAEPDQLLFAGLGAGLQHNKRAHGLAPAFVGCCDHSRFEHCRVLIEKPFHF